MKFKSWLLLVLLFIIVGLTTRAARTQPATQPAVADASAADPSQIAPSNIEVRANEEFNRGNWAVALPLLRKTADNLKKQNQLDRVGPINEDIRVCEKNLALAANVQPAPAGDVAMAADTRVPHPAPKPGETLDISIKELGNFEYDADKGGNIPPDVKALTGTDIRLRGYMIPMDQAETITQFALVPSLFSCCFGQPPQVQHTIVVHSPKGKAVSYYPDEIVVEGKLTVDEKKEDGFIVSIFEIDCSSVKPAPK